MSEQKSIAALPNLANRVKAAAIDGVIVPVAALTTLFVIDAYSKGSTFRIAGVILVILLLEPFAVSRFGGTVGHHLAGMRVRRQDIDQRLNLISATGRFIVKTLLGLPSFLVILISGKRQAIHDMLFSTIVVYKHAGALPDLNTMKAISSEVEQQNYHSIGRRVGLVVLYWVLGYLLYSMLVSALFWSCVVRHQCSAGDSLGIVLTFLAFLAGVIAIPVLAWKGKLFGLRYKKPEVLPTAERIDPT